MKNSLWKQGAILVNIALSVTASEERCVSPSVSQSSSSAQVSTSQSAQPLWQLIQSNSDQQFVHTLFQKKTPHDDRLLLDKTLDAIKTLERSSSLVSFQALHDFKSILQIRLIQDHLCVCETYKDGRKDHSLNGLNPSTESAQQLRRLGLTFTHTFHKTRHEDFVRSDIQEVLEKANIKK